MHERTLVVLAAVGLALVVLGAGVGLAAAGPGSDSLAQGVHANESGEEVTMAMGTADVAPGATAVESTALSTTATTQSATRVEATVNLGVTAHEETQIEVRLVTSDFGITKFRTAQPGEGSVTATFGDVGELAPGDYSVFVHDVDGPYESGHEETGTPTFTVDPGETATPSLTLAAENVSIEAQAHLSTPAQRESVVVEYAVTDSDGTVLATDDDSLSSPETDSLVFFDDLPPIDADDAYTVTASTDRYQDATTTTTIRPGEYGVRDLGDLESDTAVDASATLETSAPKDDFEVGVTLTGPDGTEMTRNDTLARNASAVDVTFDGLDAISPDEEYAVTVDAEGYEAVSGSTGVSWGGSAHVDAGELAARNATLGVEADLAAGAPADDFPVAVAVDVPGGGTVSETVRQSAGRSTIQPANATVTLPPIDGDARYEVSVNASGYENATANAFVAPGSHEQVHAGTLTARNATVTVAADLPEPLGEEATVDFLLFDDEGGPGACFDTNSTTVSADGTRTDAVTLTAPFAEEDVGRSDDFAVVAGVSSEHASYGPALSERFALGYADDVQTNVTTSAEGEFHAVDDRIREDLCLVTNEAALDTNADVDDDGTVDEIEVGQAPGQVITGSTDVPPGTELTITVYEVLPSKRLTATVQPDGSFATTADFSEQHLGWDFLVTLQRQDTHDFLDEPIDGRIVAPATASLAFADQETDGDAVTVDAVTTSDGGFVSLHRDTPGRPIVGTSGYLPAGTHENVSIGVDQTLDGNTTLVATAHRDSDRDETFTFDTGPSADPPYSANGSTIADSAIVSIDRDDGAGDSGGGDDGDSTATDDGEGTPVPTATPTVTATPTDAPAATPTGTVIDVESPTETAAPAVTPTTGTGGTVEPTPASGSGGSGGVGPVAAFALVALAGTGLAVYRYRLG